MKVRDVMNFVLTENDIEIPKGESMTVPDMSFTIPEILEKFRNGIDPYVVKMGQFEDEEPDFDEVNPFEQPDFDIVDAENLMNMYSNVLKEYREKKEQQELEKRKIEESELAEYRKMKAANEVDNKKDPAKIAT